MKNLFKFIFIVTLTISGLSFGQSKEDFEAFTITKSENISLQNSLVVKFFDVTKFKSLYSDVSINEKEVELLTLKNGNQAIKFNLSNEKYNLMYAIYDKEMSEFIWYFIKNTESKIEVIAPDRETIAVYSNNNGYVNMENLTERRSAFGQCMDAVEDDFTNDLVGYLSWNASPLPALVAATMCHLCTTRNRSCPPAYHPIKK